MTKGRAWLTAIFAVIVAFGAGYGWQYMRVMDLAEQLDAAQDDLAMLRLQGDIGQASLLAQRGDYEAARRLTSGFFTQLQAIADDEAGDSTGYDTILAQRDDVITALSRANPGSVDLLAALYARISGTEPPPVQMEEEATPTGAAAADTAMPGI